VSVSDRKDEGRKAGAEMSSSEAKVSSLLSRFSLSVPLLSSSVSVDDSVSSLPLSSLSPSAASIDREERGQRKRGEVGTPLLPFAKK
jgi:hypothetical protein